ncbi:hypothetical protein D3C71_1063860 [compost metagenome]
MGLPLRLTSQLGIARHALGYILDRLAHTLKCQGLSLCADRKIHIARGNFACGAQRGARGQPHLLDGQAHAQCHTVKCTHQGTQFVGCIRVALNTQVTVRYQICHAHRRRQRTRDT